MPALTRLAGADATNLVSFGRPNLADLPYAQTAWTLWRAANPTATTTQAETAIQAAIATAWPTAPVQIRVHVFDLVTPTIGVWVANVGEPVPATWWVTPP